MQQMLMQRGAVPLLSATMVPKTSGPFIGYALSLVGSSLTPSGLSNGGTVAAFGDTPPGGISSLHIAGFGSDPGQNHFTAILAAGTPMTSASASYSYGGGTATWQWGSLFGFTDSVPAAVTIT